MKRAAIMAVVLLLGIRPAGGASYRTANFVVEAPTAPAARQIGDHAERFRRELSQEWIGAEFPAWQQPCPIRAAIADNLGSGGATQFEFSGGQVYGWRMYIQAAALETLLASSLPHEVLHTVLATHFRRPLPRWADEGAATLVEGPAVRAGMQRTLVQCLQTGRGISFERMFGMREYPHDVLPLYAQGHSLVAYLVDRGGKRHFVAFLADGLGDDDWNRATHEYYGFKNVRALQTAWNRWVFEGSQPTTLVAGQFRNAPRMNPARRSDCDTVAPMPPRSPTPHLTPATPRPSTVPPPTTAPPTTAPPTTTPTGPAKPGCGGECCGCDARLVCELRGRITILETQLAASHGDLAQLKAELHALVGRIAALEQPADYPALAAQIQPHLAPWRFELWDADAVPSAFIDGIEVKLGDTLPLDISKLKVK